MIVNVGCMQSRDIVLWKLCTDHRLSAARPPACIFSYFFVVRLCFVVFFFACLYFVFFFCAFSPFSHHSAKSPLSTGTSPTSRTTSQCTSTRSSPAPWSASRCGTRPPAIASAVTSASSTRWVHSPSCLSFFVCWQQHGGSFHVQQLCCGCGLVFTIFFFSSLFLFRFFLFLFLAAVCGGRPFLASVGLRSRAKVSA